MSALKELESCVVASHTTTLPPPLQSTHTFTFTLSVSTLEQHTFSETLLWFSLTQIQLNTHWKTLFLVCVHWRHQNFTTTTSTSTLLPHTLLIIILICPTAVFSACVCAFSIHSNFFLPLFSPWSNITAVGACLNTKKAWKKVELEGFCREKNSLKKWWKQQQNLCIINRDHNHHHFHFHTKATKNPSSHFFYVTHFNLHHHLPAW